MKLLHIDSSPLAQASVSRQLTAAVVQAWQQANPSGEVVYRDVAAVAPAHLDAELLAVAKFGADQNLTPAQQAERALVDTLVDELLSADVVVIGAPMYNFSIPSQLKSYLDRLAQAGRTFRYTESGPQGLAGGRKVILVSSRGGKYAGTPYEAAMDHQEAYLKAFLGFLGMTDVTIIRAEGIAMGPDAKAGALTAANTQIGDLFVAQAA
ncbi:FMN-dependent NADH-azoreductase [Nitrospirillum sp. BR 11164]|uniref:FMN-dependent NADH-azoreductase n=1 Tax=Nitrospirillum sp. BR 11164 TaxID=3104324 RepID=UPI002AFFBE8E|nr:FMN-dependent NADH-azoreductase [Nitrospirillum sp. BR 11164]MEA1647574.1 FMN-dependent NADH-azoreductase [Nitrospirillum sp. BR 11164]